VRETGGGGLRKHQFNQGKKRKVGSKEGKITGGDLKTGMIPSKKVKKGTTHKQ